MLEHDDFLEYVACIVKEDSNIVAKKQEHIEAVNRAYLVPL